MSIQKSWQNDNILQSIVHELQTTHHCHTIWIIFAILEDYFSFRQQRYQEPKKAFQYLAQHDPKILTLFDNALSNTQNITDLKLLIEAII
jgi:hypothetical protein